MSTDNNDHHPSDNISFINLCYGIVDYFRSHGLLESFGVLIVWLFIGTTFYSIYDDFGWTGLKIE